MSFTKEMDDIGNALLYLVSQKKENSEEATRLRLKQAMLWAFATDEDLKDYLLHSRIFALSNLPREKALEILRKTRERRTKELVILGFLAQA